MGDSFLSAGGSVEEAVAEVVDAFQERVHRGERPDVETYAREHPQLADILRRVLPALEVLGPPTTAETPTSADVPGVLGDFRIVREVGRGGMGVVYEAEQVSLKRRVALKVLPLAATMDPRHLQRFHNEAQAAAGLHHTHIVPVYFVGCERGVHFYAMQFIDGQPLTAVIRQMREREKAGKSGAAAAAEEQTTAYQQAPAEAVTTRPAVGAADATPLSAEGRRGRDYYRKVAELGAQAAEALDHAHQVGIVHRDVKPGNLLLDGAGRLWVADFGLAQVRHGEASLTLTGEVVGTLRYMSPEQALAKRVPIDHRTDVYSLGATLYELLALKPAFAGEDRQELLRQVAFEEPAQPRRLDRGIPAELETIVLKAIEKRPQDRYATAQELADDLRRWLLDQPIRARRPTVVKRMARWGRRHRPLVAAVAAALLVGLTVLAGTLGWVARDRAGRRAESTKVILTALEESAFWQADRRLPEAMSAARRAEGLLAGADVEESLRHRVRTRLADLALVDRLENGLLETLIAFKDSHPNWQGANALYGQTFRDAGLDVEALPVEEAGERIRATTVAVELASCLDRWAFIRGNLRGSDDASANKLLEVARAADPDLWRTRMREALEKRDRQALRELVASAEVSLLPPATLAVLGNALLNDKEAHGKAEAFLREAQRRHPNDFWLNYNLYSYFLSRQPPQWVECIRFAGVAVALRPKSPITHSNLGVVLMDKGRLDEAIAEHREAIRLDKDFAPAHFNLGHVLLDKGQLDEAIAEYREAIRIKKDDAPARYSLGNVLLDKGQLDDAIAEYQEAIRLKKDYADAHNNLGGALIDKGRLDDAIAEYRQAIRIKKDDAKTHINLGAALVKKGRLDEAIAECLEAIRLKKDYPEAHNNLGLALRAKGRLDDAIAEYRQAIRIKKDYAEPYCNLGGALRDQGHFSDTLTALKRAHELGSRNPRWPHPSAQWVRNAERLVELDAKLPAILSGQKQPADTVERLGFAQLCQMPCKKQYAAAVRFFREAFAKEPKLADDLNVPHRYNAACAAALAGCGQGKDADKLDTKERARLRQQALDWLRADLKAYRRELDRIAAKVGPTIAQRMQHWLKDTDFAGVRGAEALARLPVAERREWQKLWEDVEALAKLAAVRPAGSRHPPSDKP